MASIDIDDTTDQYLEFAANVGGVTKGQIVAQLVAAARTRAKPPLESKESDQNAVAIHVDYDGHRTRAQFVPGPGRIEITDGPLAGMTFRTPSEAARAVVGHYKPTVSPHRNGWVFWIITANGEPLQSIRHSRP
ncbi:hypothetical protein [Phytohabitans kaempferiae]|uniref:Bacterial EndoU nuclease domain-containing protein n=1 Tax=Phytohabitans kaempferiae TaxID=1620943 RepID=A0ABV6MDB2_9ACTN